MYGQIGRILSSVALFGLLLTGWSMAEWIVPSRFTGAGVTVTIAAFVSLAVLVLVNRNKNVEPSRPSSSYRSLYYLNLAFIVVPMLLIVYCLKGSFGENTSKIALLSSIALTVGTASLYLRWLLIKSEN